MTSRPCTNTEPTSLAVALREIERLRAEVEAWKQRKTCDTCIRQRGHVVCNNCALYYFPGPCQWIPVKAALRGEGGVMDIVARLKEEAVDYEWDGIEGSLSEWPLLIEAADEITHLRARLEAREDGGPDGIECRDQTIRMQDHEITRLRVEVEGLRNVLRDVSDDLAYMIDLDYPNRNTYPDSMRRYKRDMEPVEKARALLRGEGE